MPSTVVGRGDWTVGQDCYLPFWVLLDYVKSPQQPFARCSVIRLYDVAGLAGVPGAGDGLCFQPQTVLVADLMVGPDLVANGIPSSYLIPTADLPAWARRIADWFLNYEVGDEQTPPDKLT